MKVEKDKIISIHYSLKLDSGELVDSSDKNDQPLKFMFGRNQIIPALEQAIEGLGIGDKKQTRISPENGYGLRDENLLQSVPRNQIPGDIEISEGMILGGTNSNGDKFQVIVKSFDEENVEIDLNHPLAGENLNFDVEIVGIEDVPAEDSK